MFGYKESRDELDPLDDPDELLDVELLSLDFDDFGEKSDFEIFIRPPIGVGPTQTLLGG